MIAGNNFNLHVPSYTSYFNTISPFGNHKCNIVFALDDRVIPQYISGQTIDREYLGCIVKIGVAVARNIKTASTLTNNKMV